MATSKNTLSRPTLMTIMRAEKKILTSEESLSVGGPGEGSTRRSLGFGGRRQHFRFQLVHDDFAFQIPDFDGSTCWGCGQIKRGDLRVMEIYFDLQREAQCNQAFLYLYLAGFSPLF